MEQTTYSNPYGYKKELPNDQAILLLGIFSIVLIFCCGLLGLILGIIAVVLGGQSRKTYQYSQSEYSSQSSNKVNAGYIMGWIAIGLNIISTVVGIILYALGYFK